MAFDDRELLARIIRCEAGGEGEAGMQAVATVVMNRVHIATGEYQRICMGDMRCLIYQQGQFDCIATELYGAANPQNIYATPPEPIHLRIADWALGGGRLAEVGDSLWYMNPFSYTCPSYFPYNRSGVVHTRIGGHCFFRPTSYYPNT